MTDEWKAELLAREPVFDHPEYIWDDVSFEHEIAADFEEIGASGARHSRADIKPVVLGRLASTHPLSLTGGYSIEGAEVVELVPGLAQVRYTLHGQGRVTRRSTLYRFTAAIGKPSSTRAPSSPGPPQRRQVASRPPEDHELGAAESGATRSGVTVSESDVDWRRQLPASAGSAVGRWRPPPSAVLQPWTGLLGPMPPGGSRGRGICRSLGGDRG